MPVARAAAARGASVTLVTGPTELPRPAYMEVVEVTSAREMFQAVTALSASMDLIIKAAAVADYRPRSVAADKIKKSAEARDLSLPLERTRRYFGLARRAPPSRTAPVRLLYGDPRPP